ncbi:hypothetical protein PDPE_1-01386 [Photobacterium damselae subsp. piscicida]|uniref:Uncharacterized protein n=1 Tax=Photobacterium damsela subsp. piscicida TaxID=38294 RepID=A0AAD1CD11_PHODP|nr:hypothetical protein PDPUS_1_00143 [Photobacterium damselae subsp. piscicida]BBC40546.1 hypothetical protein PDPE_1-01386 [Photobacterium damselae subsp. piscicida]GAW44036.1 hypothetical protein PDPJ_1_01450 [Photobacterium damselae subsp. piscicida]
MKHQVKVNPQYIFIFVAILSVPSVYRHIQ